MTENADGHGCHDGSYHGAPTPGIRRLAFEAVGDVTSIRGGPVVPRIALSSGHQRKIRPHRILNRRIGVFPLHRPDDLAPILLYAVEAFGEVAHW